MCFSVTIVTNLANHPSGDSDVTSLCFHVALVGALIVLVYKGPQTGLLAAQTPLYTEHISEQQPRVKKKKRQKTHTQTHTDITRAIRDQQSAKPEGLQSC